MYSYSFVQYSTVCLQLSEQQCKGFPPSRQHLAACSCRMQMKRSTALNAVQTQASRSCRMVQAFLQHSSDAGLPQLSHGAGVPAAAQTQASRSCRMVQAFLQYSSDAGLPQLSHGAGVPAAAQTQASRSCRMVQAFLQQLSASPTCLPSTRREYWSLQVEKA